MHALIIFEEALGVIEREIGAEGGHADGQSLILSAFGAYT
jgi:hypothetical protein